MVEDFATRQRRFMCGDCDELFVNRAAQAHARLSVTRAHKHPGGLSQGVTFHYRCATCGFVWSRAAGSLTGSASWIEGRPSVHGAELPAARPAVPPWPAAGCRWS
ncbi:hypothetical protein V4F39_22420 [Aquincola sp. MAHUQ-54]|uniref:C2H2-type domain-containing protein n=1 Tax=Aquincola agrisoli TaxID=3119538 RepID=A0AAW9QHE1_9BURK